MEEATKRDREEDGHKTAQMIGIFEDGKRAIGEHRRRGKRGEAQVLAHGIAGNNAAQSHGCEGQQPDRVIVGSEMFS